MKFIIKILRFLKRKTIKGEEYIEYNIGNKKFHNSLVDSMFPEFVSIGDDFTSGPGSIILAHDASPYFHTGDYRVEKTVIGNKVFLGANSVILPGVIVGDGAIIGAGSIVTKNVKPFTVVAGNPAKEICSVQDYFDKHFKRGSLVKAPKSFEKIKNNEKLRPDDILEIRKLAKRDINR